MKRVVLHIGWPKTGTTSFQLFCRTHRARLAEHGCMFPDLQVGERSAAGHEALLAALLLDPPPHLAPHAARADALLREAFAVFAGSAAPVLLLSHETLSQARGLDHAKLRALLGAAPVTIVAVVRTLDLWVESLYGQGIRAAQAAFKPLPESRLGRLPSIRALPRLRSWRAAWPDAELRVLSFERIRGSGLVSALLGAGGIAAAELTEAAVAAPLENPAAGPLATVFAGYASLGTGAPAMAAPLLAAWRAAGDPPLGDLRFGLLPPAFKAAARASYLDDLPALRREMGLDADPPAPCGPAELDYRHTLTRAEYQTLVDWLAPHAAGLPLARLRAAFDTAAPRMA